MSRQLFHVLPTLTLPHSSVKHQDGTHVTSQKIPGFPFMHWPSGWPCEPVNLYFLDIAHQLTGDSLKTYATQLTHLVRYCGKQDISIESLTDPNMFNCTVGFNPFTNSIFGLGEFQDKIENSAVGQPLCRIYFSQIISNTICIEGITDIVNALRSRTANYIYGNCVDATLFSVGEINPISGTLSIAPNPATDMATISLSKFATQPKQLVVRDETGRIVRLIQVVQGNHTILEDFGDLPRGVYTIRSEDRGILTNVLRFTKL